MVVMRSVEPSPDFKAMRDEMLAVMRKYIDKLNDTEQLACVAYMLGQMAALQDQRKYTPDMIMRLISENLMAGNRHTIEDSFKNTDTNKRN